MTWVPEEEETVEIPGPMGPMRVPKSAVDANKDTRIWSAIKSGVLGLPADAIGLAKLALMGHSPQLAVDALTKKDAPFNKVDEHAERPLRRWARETAGLDTKMSTAERFIEGAASPLNLLPPITKANVGIGALLGGTVNAVLPQHDPPAEKPPVEKENFAGGTTQGKWVPEEGTTTPPATGTWLPEPPEEGMSLTEKIGLGAGALLAYALGKKALQVQGVLKTPGPAGKTIVGPGNVADAVDPRTSAMSGRTAAHAIHVNQQEPVLAAVEKSLPNVPPNHPIGDLTIQGYDEYAKGIPGKDTRGAAWLRQPQTPIIAQPAIDPARTRAEVSKGMRTTWTMAAPENLVNRFDEFVDTGIWKGPMGDIRIAHAPRQLYEAAAAKGEVFFEKVQRAHALRNALDGVYTSGGKHAPMLTGELGTRNMVSTRGGKKIANDMDRGSVDPAKVARMQTEMLNLMRDPEVALQVRRVEVVMQQMLDAAVQFGYPASKVARMARRNPRFMPMQEKGKEPAAPGFYARQIQKMRQLGETDPNLVDAFNKFEGFMRRDPTHGGGVQMPTNIYEETYRYMNVFWHTMERNQAQRMAAYVIRNSPDPDVQNSFRMFRHTDRNAPADTTWFFDGEVKMGIHFKNGLDNIAFKLNPHHIRSSFANGVRRVSQQTNTGLPVPSFLLGKGLFYDHVVASLYRPAGSKDFGGISGMLSGGTARVGSDPTRIAWNAVAGASRVWTAKAKLALANAAERALATNLGPTWSRWYEGLRGPGSVRALADSMAQAYEDSTYALLRRAGAVGSTAFWERNLLNASTKLEQSIPEMAHLGVSKGKIWGIYTLYKDFMEGVAQSAKLQFMAHNKGRFPNADKETIGLLGNFTQRGMGAVPGVDVVLNEAHTASQHFGNAFGMLMANKPARYLASWMTDGVPYYNVFMQGTRKLLQSFKTKCGINGMIQTIGLPAIASQLYMAQDEQISEWYKQLPGAVRATTLMLPLFWRDKNLPPEERVIMLPIAPELAVFHAVTNYAAAELFKNNRGFMQDDIVDGMAMWLGIPVLGAAGLPPVYTAGAAAMGFDTRGGRVTSFQSDRLGLANIFNPASKLQAERFTGEGYSSRPGGMASSRVEAIGQAIMGSAFSMAFGMYEGVQQNIKRGKDAAEGGLTQLGNDMLRRTPVYKAIHGFHSQPAMSNMKRRLGERTQLVDKITNIADFMLRYGVQGRNTPAPQHLDAGQIQAWLNDPVFRGRAMRIKQLFDGDPALRAQMRDRNTLRLTLEQKGGVRPVTRELQKEINILRMKELALTERLYSDLQKKEKQLGFSLEDADPLKAR